MAAPCGSDGTLRILEVGAYCGYSALKFIVAASSRKTNAPMGTNGARVFTLEADPARVVIARSLIAYAGQASSVSVHTGHSRDLLPLLVAQELDPRPRHS